WTHGDIFLVKDPDRLCLGILLKTAQKFPAADEVPAYGKQPSFVLFAEKLIVAYPDKSSGRDVHQKTTDKLYPIQCKLFPFAAVFIILYFECHIFFIHTQDAAVADRYPVGVTTEVIHDCLG